MHTQAIAFFRTRSGCALVTLRVADLISYDQLCAMEVPSTYVSTTHGVCIRIPQERQNVPSPRPSSLQLNWQRCHF